jgi:hypothetical protein
VLKCSIYYIDKAFVILARDSGNNNNFGRMILHHEILARPWPALSQASGVVVSSTVNCNVAVASSHGTGSSLGGALRGHLVVKARRGSQDPDDHQTEEQLHFLDRVHAIL